jgi:hypothetical protein
LLGFPGTFRLNATVPFMLARMSPVTLPGAVVRDVQRVGERAAALGPVRFE